MNALIRDALICETFILHIADSNVYLIALADYNSRDDDSSVASLYIKEYRDEKSMTLRLYRIGSLLVAELLCN